MLMPSIFGNDFMNDFFGGFPYKSNGTMQTDVSETDKGYKVTMNLPGYQKEDIKGDRTLRAETKGEEVFGTGVSGFAYRGKRGVGI